jgi:hypothetical protein
VVTACFDGKVRALLTLAGNFGVGVPASARVLAVLKRCRINHT